MDPFAAASVSAARRPLDPNRFPNALMLVCSRIAEALGVQLASVVHNVAISFGVVAASSGVHLAVGPTRVLPQLHIAELIFSEENRHSRVMREIAAALNEACARCGTANLSVEDFSWPTLPSHLQVAHGAVSWPRCRVLRVRAMQNTNGAAAVLHKSYLASCLDNYVAGRGSDVHLATAHTLADGGPLHRADSTGKPICLATTAVSSYGAFQVAWPGAKLRKR